MIEFACSQGGKRLKVKTNWQESAGKCPHCGTSLQVPPAAPTTSSVEQPLRSVHEEPNAPPIGSSTLENPIPATTTLSPRTAPVAKSDAALDQTLKVSLAVGLLGLFLLALSPLFKWIQVGAEGITGIAGDGKIVLAISVVFIAALCTVRDVFRPREAN